MLGNTKILCFADGQVIVKECKGAGDSVGSERVLLLLSDDLK